MSVAELLRELAPELGEGGTLSERGDLAPYETGWRYGQGRAAAVVRPRTTAEVARVLAAAHARGLRAHAIGANTGLVGASNPDASGEQLVLSLERLNRTLEIDPLDRSARVSAGVTLSALNAAAEPHGLFFPIDLGADPQLGGMVVTNTGGARLLKYGDVRANLLGIEVVLADGTRVERLTRLRKDNTGLDWKQLFVGTSGRFGIVTEVVVKLAPRPRQRAAALVAATNGEALLACLAHLEQHGGDTLTAFEVVSQEALAATLKHAANVRAPFGGIAPPYTALIELSSTLARERLDLETLLGELLVEFAEAAEGVEDVLVGPPEEFWAIRHQVSESLAKEGVVLALDLSVPRARMAEYARVARARLARDYPFVRVCDFGHWGDGGTHFNLVWRKEHGPADVPAFKRELQTLLYDLAVREFGGSHSAEHGLGPHNARFTARYAAPEVGAVTTALARHFDPAGTFQRCEPAG